MLSRKATVSVLAESGSATRPNARGSTWLPSPTNRKSAAIVAQLVIRWLLAILTALLLGLRTFLIHFNVRDLRLLKFV